jgi:uncharacterized protein (TIGR00730 family)
MYNMNSKQSIRKVWVCCSASPKTKQEYLNSGYDLGQFLTTLNIQVVYGAGEKGMMGALAKGSASKGGKPYGVITKQLVGKESVTGVHITQVVDTMFERKEIMMNMSDAYLFTYGGIGTMDELYEALTLKKLNSENKPIIVHDPVDGKFRKLIEDQFNALFELGGVIDVNPNELIIYTKNNLELLDALNKKGV